MTLIQFENSPYNFIIKWCQWWRHRWPRKWIQVSIKVNNLPWIHPHPTLTLTGSTSTWTLFKGALSFEGMTNWARNYNNKNLRVLFLNSLIHNFLFELCTGIFFWNKFYSCVKNVPVYCVWFLVVFMKSPSSIFPSKQFHESLGNLYVSPKVEWAKSIFLQYPLNTPKYTTSDPNSMKNNIT